MTHLKYQRLNVDIFSLGELRQPHPYMGEEKAKANSVRNWVKWRVWTPLPRTGSGVRDTALLGHHRTSLGCLLSAGVPDVSS